MKSIKAFTIVELMIVVAIVAMLAALAMPAFIAYIRTSKTSEAVGNMRRLYEGEISYYFSEKIARVGAQIAAQFVSCPATPGTPPLGTKELGNWEQASWRAIQFAQESAVMYSYSVDVAGTGTTSSFTTRAEGDLDGDTVLSLFERSGAINSTSGDPEASSGVYISREIE